MGSVVQAIVEPVTKVAAKVLGVEQPEVKPQTAPEAPKTEDLPSAATPSVQAAAASQEKRERAASGRAATQLSSEEEKTTEKNVGTKKLLGQ